MKTASRTHTEKVLWCPLDHASAVSRGLPNVKGRSSALRRVSGVPLTSFQAFMARIRSYLVEEGLIAQEVWPSLYYKDPFEKVRSVCCPGAKETHRAGVRPPRQGAATQA
jgi:hypothetical protein